MKKVFLLISLALVLGLVLVSCPQPNDSGNSGGGEKPVPRVPLANANGETLVKGEIANGILTITPLYEGETGNQNMREVMGSLVTDENRPSIITITIIEPEDKSKIVLPARCSQLFSIIYLGRDSHYYSELTSIKGLEYLDTSNVTSMVNMFLASSKIAELDLSSWDTSNVVDMRSMFSSCNSLSKLDISGWNTLKVIRPEGIDIGAQGMFSGTALTQSTITKDGAQLSDEVTAEINALDAE